MKCSISLIMLSIFVRQAHAEELMSKLVAGTQGNLMNRVLKSFQMHPAHLDDVTLAKQSLQQSCCTCHVSSLEPRLHVCSRCSNKDLPSMARTRRLTVKSCNIFDRLAYPKPAAHLAPAAFPLPAGHSTKVVAHVPQADHAAPAARSAIVAHVAQRSSLSKVLEPTSRPTTSNSKVVLCRTPSARELFREVVSKFQCPDKEGDNLFVKAYEAPLYKAAWFLTKWDIEQRMEHEDGTRVLAMKGETACAAAIYADQHEKDTTTLYWLIRNAGDECRGAGGAIMCHLIRNSKNKWGESSPLRVLFSNQFSQTYFESFGCVQRYPYLVCEDQNPEKCQQHDDEVFTPNGASLQTLKRFWSPEAYAR